ncbi:hypothetical protein [Nonomuraea longicatena]|uniref:Uncharacterized protein n=1 Tax=Nonomuraea longicatena TaxID=83682 RepID=A0ABN1NMW3_9ACTN
MSGEPRRKFELSVPQVLGGALAAVTAAVAASYLGVAGTVIGAAVASVGTTVGGAIYTHYLKRTGEKVKEHVHRHDDGEEPAPVRRRPLPWLKLGVAAALVFAISMGTIVAYQMASGALVADQLPGRRPPASEPQRAPVQEKPGKPTEDPHPPAPPSSEPPARTPTPTPTPTPSRTPTKAPTNPPTKTPEPPVTPSAPPEPSSEPSSEPTGPEPPADSVPPDETPTTAP